MKKILLPFTIICALAAVGCAVRHTAATPPIAGDVVVSAMIEKIQPNEYVDYLEDGSVLFANVVHFSIVAPPQFKNMKVFAYCFGPPTLHGRALQPGEVVSFILPPQAEWEHTFFLYDLKELRSGD